MDDWPLAFSFWRLPAMWLVPLECRNTAVYSYIYSMCDFVGIRVKFKEETAAVKCNKPMVLIKQSWTKCMLNKNKHYNI